MQRDAIRALIIESPAVAEHLLRLLARRLRRTDDDLIDLFSTDGAGRLARWLLQLAARFATDEGGEQRVTLDVTQADIAHLIGSSRETVNKALTSFARRGWIRLDRNIVVIGQPEQLRAR